ncbi:DMT family transporter [Pseudomonas sp. sp1636]|uniref:DMT family transporter n=1 Tax=Pseudomonas sp. sp1636 TaxID=3036707 RepID=UPI0025A541FF|nr:DMT family transporter [Pseudomonas sp. sp1636]MDM8350369.1 DMT family transporter [Pseudomonas sp. sp1636]
MPWKSWSSERLGIAFALLAAFGFSFKAIFVKLAYAAAPVDAITLLTLRMTFALPIALWASLWLCRSAPPLTRRDWGLLIALGLLGYYGASILDFLGLQYISAALERLILFIYPTLTVLIGVLVLGQRLERRQVGALLLSYAGIALAFAHDLQVADDIDQVLIGAALVFASALSYAFYSAGAEVAIRRLGSIRFAALAIIVSSLASQLHFVATQPFSALLQPLEVYLYGAAMAVFSTLLPVFWQSAALRHIGAARTVLIGTLGPMLTIFFAWGLLAEPVSLAQLAGAGLVLAGVLLVSARKRLPDLPPPVAEPGPAQPLGGIRG